MRYILWTSVTAIILTMGLNQAVEAKKGQQSSDAKATYAEANQLAKESNQIAGRCLALVEDSKVVGTATMNQFKKQREQINRMDDDLETVNVNLEESKRKLRSIGSIWGTITNAFTPSASKKRKRKKSVQVSQVDQPIIGSTQAQLSDGLPFTYPQDEDEKELARNMRTLDRTLDQVDSTLDELHRLALNMGHELEGQNVQLDRVHRGIARTTPRIDQAIGQCGAIVR